MSVADDGGSSGRLRRDLGVPPPGDIRRCLVALAGDDTRVVGRVRAPVPRRRARGPRPRQPRARRPHRDARQLPRRARRGRSSAREPWAGSCRRRSSRSCSRPSSADRRGRGPGGGGEQPRDPPRSSWCRPTSPPRPTRSRPSRAADQVVYAPGSLYTSVLPVLCVDGLRRAIGEHRGPGRAGRQPPTPDPRDRRAWTPPTTWRRSWPTAPGSTASSTTPAAASPVDAGRVRALGVEPVGAAVARADGLAHDPEQLAKALCALL